jgi:hypothetical protein
MSLDPVIDFTLRGLLAAILAIAAIHKLRDRATFEGQLAGYDLLPAGLIHPASRAIPLIEAAIALFLLARSEHASITATLLLLAYAGAMGLNLMRGRSDIDCGCGGADGRQVLHWALVLRNLVLAAGAAAISLPVSPRPLNWLDYPVAAAATLTTIAIYLAFNALVAQIPATAKLKA